MVICRSIGFVSEILCTRMNIFYQDVDELRSNTFQFILIDKMCLWVVCEVIPFN